MDTRGRFHLDLNTTAAALLSVLFFFLQIMENRAPTPAKGVMQYPLQKLSGYTHKILPPKRHPGTAVRQCRSDNLCQFLVQLFASVLTVVYQ
jgi:hypothetical protein